MTDTPLHHDALREWRDDMADEYVQAQRRAFLDGFEAAADEAETFRHLRDWLEAERDEAKANHKKSDGNDRFSHVRYLTFVDVLVKLHQMGCEPEETTDD